MIYGFDIDGTICSTDCDYSEQNHTRNDSKDKCFI